MESEVESRKFFWDAAGELGPDEAYEVGRLPAKGALGGARSPTAM